jgi:tetratricopeptide (TPR) repeat protein
VRQDAPAVLVGRQRELDVLHGALARATSERETQLVTLVGVPGIGKSRLVFEVLRAVDASSDLVFWRQGRCLPYGEGVTFWAVAEMVKSHAGILETDSSDAAGAKLRATLEDFAPDEAAGLERHLRPLLGIAGPAEGAGASQESFPAWRSFFEALAERYPLVLVFEDLHWADESLLDFVDHIVDWARGVPILVLCTARPELLERRPGWGGGKRNATTVALTPLSNTETAELMGALAAYTALPDDAREAILDRAAGNPLYAEQFVRMLADRAGDPAALTLPETVQGIIAARLDGLPVEEKALLQHASVIGKVFWSGALRALAEADDGELEQLLHSLERKDIVRRERRSSVGDQVEYAFRHALLRDVAYNQIPRAARSDLHRRAAEWIEALSDRSEGSAEMLAHHWVEAATYARLAGTDAEPLEERAREALAEAGHRAMALGALDAGARLFGRAAELWPAGSEGRDIAEANQAIAAWYEIDEAAASALVGRLLELGQIELAARLELWIGSKAWDEGRGKDALERQKTAVNLVRDLPASRDKAQIVNFYALRLYLLGESEAALPVAEEALAISTELGAEDERAAALIGLGTTLVYLGRVEEGLERLREGIEVARTASARQLIRGLKNLGTFQIDFGKLEEGFALQAEALRTAERSGNAWEVHWFEVERAIEDYWTGRWERAAGTADALLADPDGTFSYMGPVLRNVRALVALARGENEAARRDADEALEFSRRSGDPQLLLPIQAVYARVLAAERARGAADMAQLVLTDPRSLTSGFSTSAACAAATLDELGQGSLFDAESPPPDPNRPWWDAAEALCGGRHVEAAERYRTIGSLPDEAWARLRAGETLLDDGHRVEAASQLERALAFWRSVGATAYAARAEAALNEARPGAA